MYHFKYCPLCLGISHTWWSLLMYTGTTPRVCTPPFSYFILFSTIQSLLHWVALSTFPTFQLFKVSAQKRNLLIRDHRFSHYYCSWNKQPSHNLKKEYGNWQHWHCDHFCYTRALNFICHQPAYCGLGSPINSSAQLFTKTSSISKPGLETQPIVRIVVFFVSMISTDKRPLLNIPL